MHVVIAPDAFTGSLSAVEAAAAIADGWARSAPGARLTQVPLSDGGPGFVDVLGRALPGAQLLPVTVADPLGRPVPATLLHDEASGTVYVESAQACGLHLLAAPERNPEQTGTTGVGELLAAALAVGAQRVVVGLGGSGTHDGGRGALEVLDFAWPDGVELVIASDVNATYDETSYFAPQKGAAPEQLPVLAERLEEFAAVAEARTGRRVRRAEGSGAAGGLGFGLLSLGGIRRPGIAVVTDVVGLPARLAEADLAVTGEGGYDGMSLRGKVCGGVAHLAQAAGRPCLVLAGSIAVGAREARAHGIDELRSTSDLAGSVEESLRRPAYWLGELAARTAAQWSRA